jgi:hypothetical protein
MPRNRKSATPSIDELRSHFEQWRQIRQGRARIPDELWSAAVTLARRDGVNSTATILHLDAGKLKKRMLASRPPAAKRTPPAFVELVAAGADDLPQYTLEVEAENGKLRIYCKGATATELAELSRALWGLAS